MVWHFMGDTPSYKPIRHAYIVIFALVIFKRIFLNETDVVWNETGLSQPGWLVGYRLGYPEDGRQGGVLWPLLLAWFGFGPGMDK